MNQKGNAGGEPRMVMSEGGEWSYPIKVYANNEVETFVPDITAPGWVSWHVAEFRQKGTYFTYLYIYHRKSRNTGRETVYVDTRANTAIVARPLIAPTRVDISKAPLELAKSISKITSLVTDETGRYRGNTVQGVIEQDEDEAAREMCQQQGGCDPTIVRNPRTPLRLIPGAVPGVNCGIGTEKSCCCANDSTVSNSSALPSIAQTEPGPTHSPNASETPNTNATTPTGATIAGDNPMSAPQPATNNQQPAISPTRTFMVQIATLSSQDVANILLASLQKKGYSAAVRHEPQDNLLHVQIGPFATRQDAVAMQQRVLADGFNSIIK
jgi:cell division septation protein DedD